MRAFNKSLEEVTKGAGKLLYRAPCKNVNFGVVYGLAGPGLYDLMCLTYAPAGLPVPEWLTLAWCEDFINKWFDLYPEVRAYMEMQYYRVKRYGIAWDMFGRTRRVPEMQSALKWIQGAGLRQAGNLASQAGNAGVMKLTMGEADGRLLELLDSGVWVWPLLTIHDELVTETEEDYADLVGEILGEVMDNVLTDKQTGHNYCRVPIQSDGKSMDRWIKE